jgi:lysophospholipase L1-like esterase
MKDYKVVVWGDSIAANGPKSWPEITEFICNNFITTGKDVEIINSAVGGKPAARARNEFSERVQQHNPELVIIQFGLNDMRFDGKRGDKPISTLEEFGKHLREMILCCKDIPAEVIIFGNHRPAMLITFPDEKTIEQKYQEYNAVAAEVAKTCSVEFHDMSKLEVPGGNWRDLVCEDGIHLSETGKHLFGQFAASVIMQKANSI